MRTFRACFKLQFRLLLVKRNLVLAALFLALTVYFVHSGAAIYKDIIKDKDQFVQVEKEKVEKVQNYLQYAFMGIRIKFIPSPLSIFFANSGFFSNLSAEFDAFERLNFNMSVKGNYMFQSKNSNYDDFKGLLLFIGSLSVLMLGLGTLRSMDFLKTASCFSPNKKIFFSMANSRFLVISLYFLIVFALGMFIILLNGIRLSGWDYLVMAIFYGAWLVISGFLFWLGCFIGHLSRKKPGILPVFLSWLILVFAFPLAVNKITVEKSTTMVSNSQMELEKIQQLRNFEDRASKEAGEYSKEKAKAQEGNDIIGSFFNNEYLKMMAVDQNLEEITKKIIDFYHWTTSATPLTFLIDISADIGSNGYDNGLLFMRYCRDLKDRFCRFYAQKRFSPNGSKETKVENFIKGEENVFYGKSQLPVNFLVKILYQFLLLIAMIFLSYLFFNPSFWGLNKKEIEKLSKEFENPKEGKDKEKKIDIKPGKISTYYTYGPVLKDILFSLLAGKNEEILKRGFTGKVLLNNQDIVKEKNYADFLYICPFDALPQEITVKAVLSFFADLQGLTGSSKIEFFKSRNLQQILEKRVYSLKDDEKVNVLVSIAYLKSFQVYLFYETVNSKSVVIANHFVKVLKELNEKGAAAIYLCTYPHTQENKNVECNFHELPTWHYDVESRCKNFETILEDKND